MVLPVDSSGVALVQGASRGLGLALVSELLDDEAWHHVVATCRDPVNAEDLRQLANPRLSILQLDVEDECSVASASDAAATLVERIDLLINVSGVLHDGDELRPERRLADVVPAALERAFRVNATSTLLVARAFERLLRNSKSAVFASLSARVGSISDNRLGGWYAYRASKAALNMMIRTLAIEWGRFRPSIRCVALHPGTVATDLSAPFVSEEDERRKVFKPQESAKHLINVLRGLGPNDSGKFFAWDGQAIPW